MNNDLFTEVLTYCDTLAGYRPEGGYLGYVVSVALLLVWWLLISPRRRAAAALKQRDAQKRRAQELEDRLCKAIAHGDENDRKRVEAEKKLKALAAAHADDAGAGADDGPTLHDILAVSSRAHADWAGAAQQTCLAAIKAVESAAGGALAKLEDSASGVRNLSLKALELFAAAHKEHAAGARDAHEKSLAAIQELSATALAKVHETAALGCDEEIGKAIEAMAEQHKQSHKATLKLVRHTVPPADLNGEEDVDDDPRGPSAA